MNKIPNAENETADNGQTAQQKQESTLRIVWSILLVVFAAIILLRLYDWSRGTGGLRQILSPLGMVCVGLARTFAAGNKNLQTILIAIGLILVVAGLLAMIVY